MAFVYIHLLWFAVWIVFGVEDYPFGLLTMIVSLEAIFLSTFVMISQNRADAKRQVLADHAVGRSCRARRSKTRICSTISSQILEMTKAIHALTLKTAGGATAADPAARELTQGSRSRARSTLSTRLRAGIGEIAVDRAVALAQQVEEHAHRLG